MEFDRILEARRLIAEVDDEATRSSELISLDLTNLLKDASDCKNRDYCVVCQIIGKPANPRTGLQEHHIAGKVYGQPNFSDTIPVCTDSCHRHLSEFHDAWYSRSTNTSTRLSCYFFGWADIFLLLHIRSGLPYFEILAAKFRAKGRDLRLRLSKRRLSTIRCTVA